MYSQKENDGGEDRDQQIDTQFVIALINNRCLLQNIPHIVPQTKRGYTVKRLIKHPEKNNMSGNHFPSQDTNQ